MYDARTDILFGKWRQADDKLALDIAVYRDQGNRSFEITSRLLLARLKWLSRDAAGAQREIRLILSEADDVVRVEELRVAGSLLAQMGESRAARSVLARIQSLDRAALVTGFGRSCLGNLQGEIALAEGRIAEAKASFVAAAEAFPQHMSWVGMAQLQQQRREWSVAPDTWQSVLDESGDIIRFGFPGDLPLARLERARVLRRAGLENEAVREYAALRDQWHSPDPGSLADEARRESEKQINVARP